MMVVFIGFDGASDLSSSSRSNGRQWEARVCSKESNKGEETERKAQRLKVRKIERWRLEKRSQI